MPGYTIVNLREVEDQAPKFGFAPNMEARFAREALQLRNSGVGLAKIAPNFRIPFGHRHAVQEELYVIVSGGGRMKIDDAVVELGTWDAVRVPAEKMRCFEAGPEGAEILAFGAPQSPGDGEIVENWWAD